MVDLNKNGPRPSDSVVFGELTPQQFKASEDAANIGMEAAIVDEHDDGRFESRTLRWTGEEWI